jgi:hypothetical protein
MCAVGKIGIIIAGEPAVGKSTLLLALCRAGAGLIGDELGLLSEGTEGPELLAFPIRCKLRRHVGPVWDWSDTLPDAARVPTSDLGVRVLIPQATGLAMSKSARALLLVEVCDRASGVVIEPMDEVEAAIALTMYDVFYGERHAPTHFARATSLAAALQSYRVVLGRDPDRIVAEILEIARGLAAGT